MNTRISSLICKISGLSYEMFLIHHVLILMMVRIYRPTNTALSIIFFIVVVFVTYLGAWFIHEIKFFIFKITSTR